MTLPDGATRRAAMAGDPRAQLRSERSTILGEALQDSVVAAIGFARRGAGLASRANWPRLRAWAGWRPAITRRLNGFSKRVSRTARAEHGGSRQAGRA